MRPWYPRKKNLAHLSEVLVEKAVHDGVHAGGAHGGEMDHGEPDEHALLVVRLVLLKENRLLADLLGHLFCIF